MLTKWPNTSYSRPERITATANQRLPPLQHLSPPLPPECCVPRICLPAGRAPVKTPNNALPDDTIEEACFISSPTSFSPWRLSFAPASAARVRCLNEHNRDGLPKIPKH